MMPRRRALLLTVSKILGVKPYLSQSGLREEINWSLEYLRSMKIARKTFCCSLLPGNSKAASSSNPWILAILFELNSIFVPGAFWKTVKDAGLIRNEVKDGKVARVRFRFHDLRHTFGSRLGMAGVDLKTIMEIMDHKSHRVAMRYQHPGGDHKLRAVKILDRIRESNVIPLQEAKELKI